MYDVDTADGCKLLVCLFGYACLSYCCIDISANPPFLLLPISQSPPQNEPQVDALLAAISFHDAWTYMMHNASEDALPEIDGAIPKLNTNDDSCPARTANEVVMTKYGCDTHPSSVAADPDNQMWMQGPPPVFLNNEAHLISRSLDAFACAIRSCCDQANTSFEGMAKASGVDILGNGKGNVDNGNVDNGDDSDDNIIVVA